MIASRKKSIDKPKQCFKRQTHHFAKKYLYCQSYGFSSSRVQLWEFDDKEGWKKKKSEVTQSWLTLCDPMDYSLPESSIHGILQARILEWVAIFFSMSPEELMLSKCGAVEDSWEPLGLQGEQTSQS